MKNYINIVKKCFDLVKNDIKLVKKHIDFVKKDMRIPEMLFKILKNEVYQVVFSPLLVENTEGCQNLIIFETGNTFIF